MIENTTAATSDGVKPELNQVRVPQYIARDRDGEALYFTEGGATAIGVEDESATPFPSYQAAMDALADAGEDGGRAEIAPWGKGGLA